MHADAPLPDPTLAGLRAALETDAWFATCSNGFADALLTMAQTRQLGHGESLFVRGSVAEGLCCVLSGGLRVSSLQTDGSELLLAYLEPYQWFGEISLIDGAPRTHDATADGVTRLALVPDVALQAWLQSHPQHWRELARLTCAKLRTVFGVLEDIALLPLEQRLAKRLWLVAHGYGTRSEPARRHVRLPQEQLALMLGVSRQTVNKALRSLERSGVLALGYGEIELLDLPALRVAGGVG